MNKNENVELNENENENENESVIPRHVPENPYNYTKLELAERKKTLQLMQADYPNLPFGWLEMVYDFNKNTPEEEVINIINEGKFETPGMFTMTRNDTVNEK